MLDLKRARRSDPPFLWVPRKANHVCAFIEELQHVEGTWDTKRIVLEPAQIFFLCNLFGFRNPDGTRRFTTALFSVARKNAKSTLAAAIEIYCFVEEDEVGPQVISAATTGKQARIVLDIARRMVEKDEDLKEWYNLEVLAYSIVSWKNGGKFDSVNAKASTQDGLNPSCLCFDELHAHKNHDLYNVLRSAAGSRKNPLFLYTTTEGITGLGPWNEMREFAKNVLKGAVKADHFLAIYYTLDKGDDEFDESKWIKANPLLGVSVSIKKMREYATEARMQPGSLAEFRIKRVNVESASADAWLHDLHKWNLCATKIDFEELKGKPCYGALDLSSTQDMTAWRLLWQVGDYFYTWGRYWVPEKAVQRRNTQGLIKYGPWIDAGYLKVTPGDVIDYEIIEQDIIRDCEMFRPKKVAFDAWNAAATVNKLQKHSIVLEQFIQGPRSFSPAMKQLEVDYLNGRLKHEGNPILTWNMVNVVPRLSTNMDLMPDRKKSTDKIDGAIALFMCRGFTLIPEDKPKEYSIMIV